jgi:hypothetical protein
MFAGGVEKPTIYLDDDDDNGCPLRERRANDT